MRLFITMIGLMLIASCQQQLPVSMVDVESTQVKGTGFVEPDEFSKWPSVTAKPIRVGRGVWMYCRSPTPDEEKQIAAEEKQFGLHYHHYLMVRVNEKGQAAFRDGKAIPIGSIVVKEKYQDHLAKGPMAAYALMIKREADYDPEHGDWQYVYVQTQPEQKVSEGKLPNCIQCHQGARDTDYLFRFYLQNGPE
jgi:hypothetical protein